MIYYHKCSEALTAAKIGAERVENRVNGSGEVNGNFRIALSAEASLLLASTTCLICAPTLKEETSWRRYRLSSSPQKKHRSPCAC